MWAGTHVDCGGPDVNEKEPRAVDVSSEFKQVVGQEAKNGGYHEGMVVRAESRSDF